MLAGDHGGGEVKEIIWVRWEGDRNSGASDGGVKEITPSHFIKSSALPPSSLNNDDPLNMLNRALHCMQVYRLYRYFAYTIHIISFI